MAKPKLMGGRTHVVVVDDDADTRLCFKDILQSERTFSFAGEFSSAGEALTGIPHLRPDLVLMDINLADMDGIECTKRLKRIVPTLKVVIASGNRETTWFDRSTEAGVTTYLVKPVEPAQLIATLLCAARAENPFKKPVEKFESGSISILNQRERAVLGKLAAGMLYKEIPDALGISYTAVHKCQYRIFRKLHVSNRSEAIRIWLQRRGNC